MLRRWIERYGVPQTLYTDWKNVYVRPPNAVELPFAALKYRIFGHPRFLLRGLAGAQTEINLATLVYNLKRMLNVLGGYQLPDALTD